MQELNPGCAAHIELGELPGIGPRLASRILARREQLGGRFESVEELASVPGFGRRKTGLLRPLIRVDATPAPDPDVMSNAPEGPPDAEPIPTDAAMTESAPTEIPISLP